MILQLRQVHLNGSIKKIISRDKLVFMLKVAFSFSKAANNDGSPL